MLNSYPFAFNGKENDSEVNGQQDYGMRIYDYRLGRFKSLDPLTAKFPMLTPFQFASNTPIMADDLDGAEARVKIISTYKYAYQYFDSEGMLQSKMVKETTTNTYEYEGGNPKYWAYADREKYGTTGTMTVYENEGKSPVIHKPTLIQQTYENIKNKTYDALMSAQNTLHNYKPDVAGMGGVLKVSNKIFSATVRPELYSTEEDNVGFTGTAEFSLNISLKFKKGLKVESSFQEKASLELGGYLYTKNGAVPKIGLYPSIKATHDYSLNIPTGYTPLALKSELSIDQKNNQTYRLGIFFSTKGLYSQDKADPNGKAGGSGKIGITYTGKLHNF